MLGVGEMLGMREKVVGKARIGLKWFLPKNEPVQNNTCKF